ncbi:hypothetical protein MY5147_009141 [Beauveria neobassiana]
MVGGLGKDETVRRALLVLCLLYKTWAMG